MKLSKVLVRLRFIVDGINAKNKTLSKSLKELLKKEKELKQKQQEWLKDNPIDKKKHIKKWEKLSKNTKKEIFDIIIRYLSISDGALQVNGSLEYGLELQDVNLDPNLVNQIQQKLLKVELTTYFLNKSIISNDTKKLIIEQVIKREFPEKITQKPPQNYDNILENLKSKQNNQQSTENPYGLVEKKVNPFVREK